MAERHHKHYTGDPRQDFADALRLVEAAMKDPDVMEGLRESGALQWLNDSLLALSGCYAAMDRLWPERVKRPELTSIENQESAGRFSW